MTIISPLQQESLISSDEILAGQLEANLSTIGASIAGQLDLESVNIGRKESGKSLLDDSIDRVYAHPVLVAMSSVEFNSDGSPLTKSAIRYQEIVSDLAVRDSDTIQSLYLRAVFQALKSEAIRNESRDDPVKGLEHIFGEPIDRGAGDILNKFAKTSIGSVLELEHMSQDEMNRAMQLLLKDGAQIIITSLQAEKQRTELAALGLGSAVLANETNTW